ncbi:SpvB/TcaC N-terminal domain-containing protein [Streptomyces sp. NPDC005963]|uniref:SpvB/TcaC N-terminal domain-containing protein n=1 Tax=Streptomyces sp. NPDC005963 TaxID=3156721 RepID=UPI0033DFBB82
MLDSVVPPTPSRQSPSATARQDDTGVQPPSVTLPKGGGAIRGIGEKFETNAVNGTGTLAVPLAASPGRSGFGPSPTLRYDSGSGNGPFGYGWQLSLPAITRKTDKGLPRYGDDPEDVFLISGSEDLVPEPGPCRRVRTDGGHTFAVRRYRPRTEGLFARIERWTDTTTAETHWRSISAANVTTLYGRTSGSRIADPADPLHVFSWLICESYDTSGNAMVYEYKPEDSDGLDLGAAHERNRTRTARSANRYPKRIRYGNTTPRRADGDPTHPAPDSRVTDLPAPAAAVRTVPTHTGDHDAPPGCPDRIGPETTAPTTARPEWMFELVFDYGEHDPEHPLPAESMPWSGRPDPFSTYRAGFEIRTHRLCRRTLMFHHFPAEPGVGPDCLVRSTDFAYREDPTATTLEAVTQAGYRRPSDTAGYVRKPLPPLEFGYTEARVDPRLRELPPESLENLPTGPEGPGYRWVDLDGDGVAGILTEQAGGWFYRRALGDGRYEPVRQVVPRPAPTLGGGAQLVDLAGDGQLDLVEFEGGSPGFYERTADADWSPFRPFLALPALPWRDPNLRLVDLTGDGLADVLITEDEVISWYPSLGEDGFAPAQRVRPSLDEDSGPRLVLADREQSIHLADMSGDGLTDLVRIRNGEVCYWPNLGYGRFGPKTVMGNAPWFDEPDQFDQRRVRLADIDGTGPVDILYLHRSAVRIHRNRSGNSWAPPEELPVPFPRADSLAQVSTVDLLGNGTACLVWSSPLPSDTGRHVRYVDLMGGEKPRLLVRVSNGLGAETRISYARSTAFSLADRAAGRPWVTQLPFPVHVVERIETLDRISGNRFTSRYAYHHGHFDGVEREFHGFGMVEQWDTESFAALATTPDTPFDPATHVPPVLTRTWFHTGADDAGRSALTGEYFREPDGNRTQLAESTVPAVPLTPDERRQAHRALRGAVLRHEVYALDGTEVAGRPYTVSEHNYTVRLLQHADRGPRPPGAEAAHAVFLVEPKESVTAHYERTLDPRTSHEVVLETDDFGNVLSSASIAYGRHIRTEDTSNPDDRAPQERRHVVHTQHRYTNAVDLPDAHHTPALCETRVWEVWGLCPEGGLFTPAELDAQLRSITREVPSERWDEDPTVRARRLLAHTRTRFRRDDLSGPLPLGSLEPRALPYLSHRLALTPGLVTELYGDRVDDELLSGPGAYVRQDGDDGWWIPSGRVFYSPHPDDPYREELAHAQRHFFLPHRFQDPFGELTEVSYDPYDLLTRQVRDPAGNLVTVGERDEDGRPSGNGNDYRVLSPRLVTDANRNRAEVLFDALGMVVATAVTGRTGEALGDTLDGIEPDPDDTLIADYFEAPLTDPHRFLGGATTRVLYDLFAYARTRHQQRPDCPALSTLTREAHAHDLAEGEQSPVQQSFSYSDGFGREIQQKVQAEAGPLSEGGPVVEPRWVGTGWTVFNNKGKPVRTYEPFFSATHAFEFAVAVGVSPVLFYDPVERVVATLHPDDSWEKVTFDPWHQKTWDLNDTVLADPREDSDVGGYVRNYLSGRPQWRSWYEQRIDGSLGAAERSAAEKTAVHAATPAVQWLDSLGRPYLSLAHNRFREGDTTREERYTTRHHLDVEGNERGIVDPLGRTLVRQKFDLSSSKASVDSADAGQTVTVQDCGGKTILSWDGRGYTTRLTYDALRRPVGIHVSRDGGPELLVERTVYGESHPDAETLGLRTHYYQHYDGAGVVTAERYDFKGNVLRTSRSLAAEYRETVDWFPLGPLSDAEIIDHPPHELLEPDEFVLTTTYDALNRPVTITSPDRSVVRPGYNSAGLLERVDVRLRDADPRWTPFVTGIDYDARARRTLIHYGNAIRSEYAYDPMSHRLARLRTTQQTRVLQDLGYVYDPSGNVVHVRDDAQQTVFFDNTVVEPHTDHTFDALYRLVAASGREHIGSLPTPQPTWNDEARRHLTHPHDGAAMRTYTERYSYDEVGNILALVHRAAGGDWTRRYHYAEPSVLEPERHSNRLTSTRVGAGPLEPYAYDAHGNTLTMPHLAGLEWDHKDRLHHVDRGGGGIVHYVYDSNGQRVRKVADRHNGTRQSERIYVGGFEVYREYEGDGKAVALERTTLHVMDDARRVARVENRTVGDDGTPEHLIRYQFDNLLGTVCLEADDQGVPTSYEEYHPFGSTSYQAVRFTREPLKRYRFTGKERDEETGLYYHGARYYAPWLGRWSSVDPAGLIDGLAPYTYVRNNPVTLSDPTGHLSLGQWVGIGVAVLVGTVVTIATAGLAGPVVGATAAAVIGGIIGGAAGGAAGEIAEALTDGRAVTKENVGKAALIGGITGGVLAGAGAGVSAALGTTAGKAVVTKVASSAIGQGVGGIAKRVAQSVVGRGASRANAAIKRPSERAGQWIADRVGTGPRVQAARTAQLARERAAATTRNAQGVKDATREITSATGEETFSHSVAWRGGDNGGFTGALVESQSGLQMSTDGLRAQWGEGAYAFGGPLEAGSTGSAFQFKVAPQTAIETVTVPGRTPIVRLVPPPGSPVVPIRITGNNFPPGVLEEGREAAAQAIWPRPQPPVPFGYPRPSTSDASGLTGGLGGLFGTVLITPIAPQDDQSPTVPSVGVRF